MFQMLDVISLVTPQWKWPHLAWTAESPGFFRVLASALDLRWGDPLWWPQERPVPMRVARGPIRIPLLAMPGPKNLCGVGAGT